MIRTLPFLLVFCDFLSPALIAQTIQVPTKFSLAIPHEYDEAFLFSEGFAGVKKQGKWGFIDTKGQVVVKIEWDEVKPFTKQCAAVRKGSEWFYVDTHGAIRTPALERVSVIDTLMKGQINGKWGAYNPDFTIAIPFIHEFFYQLDPPFLHICPLASDEEGISTRTGDTILPTVYMRVRHGDGVFLAANSEFKSAFFNQKGEALTPFAYSYFGTEPFEDDVAIVQTDENYGLIDKQFNVLRDGFAYLSDIQNGRCIAGIGEYSIKVGIYNYLADTWTIEAKYDRIFSHLENTYSCERGDTTYLLNALGEQLMPPLHGDIIAIIGEIVLFRNTDYKEGCYSLNSKKLLAPNYTSITTNVEGTLILAQDANGHTVFNSRMEVLVKNVVSDGDYTYISEGMFAVQNNEGKFGFLRFE